MQVHRESETRVAIHLPGASPLYIESSKPLTPKLNDFAVWLGLIYYNRRSIDMRLDVPISKDCLFNAGLMQQYLSRYLGWKPISIQAPVEDSGVRSVTEHPPTTRRDRVITTYSGGVDSVFTVLHRHEMGYPVDAALFATGLDIPVIRDWEASLARERCSYMLEVTGTPLYAIRTNFRDVASVATWELESDFVLAGLLHLFDAEFQRGLISGAGDAGEINFSESFGNPNLNERLFHLFSGGPMLIDNYEGAFHDKVQKVGYVCRHDAVRQYLRVCWVLRNHTNCGVCSKCVIIQLCALAYLGYIPPCFTPQVTVDQARRMFHTDITTTPHNYASPWYQCPRRLSLILRYAARNGVRHEMLDMVRELLLECRFPLPEEAL